MAKRRHEVEKQNILGIESQVNMCEKKETTTHQATADQKDNGKSYLGDYQSGAKLSMLSAAAYAFAAAGQMPLQIPTHPMKRRCQSAHQSRHQRSPDCEKQNWDVKPDYSFTSHAPPALRDRGLDDFHPETGQNAADQA